MPRSFPAFRAALWLLSMVVPPLAHGQVGVDRSREPALETRAEVSSSLPDSTHIAYEVPGGMLTLEDATGANAGVLVVADERLVVAEFPAAIRDGVGSVQWSLALAELHSPDEAPRWVGVVISKVQLTGPQGVSRQFMVASLVSPERIAQEMESLRSSPNVGLAAGEAPSGDAGRFGASCTCAGADGVPLFSVPFISIGFGASREIEKLCCQFACLFATQNLQDGYSDEKAWLLGQSTWASCLAYN